MKFNDYLGPNSILMVFITLSVLVTHFIIVYYIIGNYHNYVVNIQPRMRLIFVRLFFCVIKKGSNDPWDESLVYFPFGTPRRLFIRLTERAE